MMLAGLRVPDDDVRELARLVDEPTRSVLEKALALGTVVLALTIEDASACSGRSTMPGRTRWPSSVPCSSGARVEKAGRTRLTEVVPSAGRADRRRRVSVSARSGPGPASTRG